jgi:hypothetical protein
MSLTLGLKTQPPIELETPKGSGARMQALGPSECSVGSDLQTGECDRRFRKWSGTCDPRELKLRGSMRHAGKARRYIEKYILR